MLTPRLKALLLYLASRQDLMLVVLLVVTIAMMILPLPTVLVDILLASNMALTVLLLMVGIYLKDPIEFSTLPAVILFVTIFRLSLSITTTRLILIQADAGEIIATFGEFVIAGNVIVGLVIFLIITIVQFVVITKGAERVAEVSARFTLDALPGKQMSIDSDLRNGDIDQVEARRRRRLLQKESQLYGAMDGAMKFVKGDAIAGIVIILVNLVGGIAVGTLSHGMSIGEASQVYSLLTVGDGLVAQIPALLVSITAGTIVTRVMSDDAGNLGADIVTQLATNPRTLSLAATVLVFLGMVPGFPTLIFIALAAGFGGLAFLFHLRDGRAVRQTAVDQEEREAAEAAEIDARADDVHPVNVQVASDLADAIGRGSLTSRMNSLRQAHVGRTGVPCPPVSISVSRDLKPGHYRIFIEDVPVAEASLPIGSVLLRDHPDHLELANIPSKPGGPFLDRSQTSWVDVAHVDRLTAAGIGHLDIADCLVEAVSRAISRYAVQFFGIGEMQQLLTRMSEQHGDLVRELQRIVPVQRMTDVFRRLLEEGVSLRNLRRVFEALVDWGAREQDEFLLAEYVRGALGRQICHAHANDQKALFVLLLEQDAEALIRGAIRQTSAGHYLALSDLDAERVLAAFRTQWTRCVENKIKPVVLSSLDIRRFVRSLLIRNNMDLPVLSYQELAPEFTVQPVATVRLAQPGPAASALGGSQTSVSAGAG